MIRPLTMIFQYFIMSAMRWLLYCSSYCIVIIYYRHGLIRNRFSRARFTRRAKDVVKLQGRYNSIIVRAAVTQRGRPRLFLKIPVSRARAFTIADRRAAPRTPPTPSAVPIKMAFSCSSFSPYSERRCPAAATLP